MSELAQKEPMLIQATAEWLKSMGPVYGPDTLNAV